jgi:hypothetical protein
MIWILQNAYVNPLNKKKTFNIGKNCGNGSVVACQTLFSPFWFSMPHVWLFSFVCWSHVEWVSGWKYFSYKWFFPRIILSATADILSYTVPSLQPWMLRGQDTKPLDHITTGKTSRKSAPRSGIWQTCMHPTKDMVKENVTHDRIRTRGEENTTLVARRMRQEKKP